ncbi:MAG: alanine racemase [Pseudomonadota bacterium]|nr:alanine racemase [Pseudomonadota bacterium]
MVEDTGRLTKACIHLSRLSHNLRLLQAEVGERPLWPVVKADAYGHGSVGIARHLLAAGYETLGVADIGEAAVLADAGVYARFIILSATLPEHSEAIIGYDCEPVVCTYEMVDALARDAGRAGKRVSVHVKVDTGMGRVGIRPDGVVEFLEHCRAQPGLRIRGIMSHFPRADEADKGYSLEQMERFRRVIEATGDFGIEVRHMANSAGILDLPGSHLDAVRPGIAIYGLRPSWEIANPRVHELKPVLELKTRIVFIKEVPAGTGLSYGHAYHTLGPSRIATLPTGYGDGLSRRLSSRLEVLIHGTRCPQVGRITMDMSLVDVTALGGQVALGDEAVIIGRQGEEEVTADELAQKLDTINYEVVTRIGHRVPRVVVAELEPGAAHAVSADDQRPKG